MLACVPSVSWRTVRDRIGSEGACGTACHCAVAAPMRRRLLELERLLPLSLLWHPQCSVG